MSWQKIRDFFSKFGHVTVDGLLLFTLNRNREKVLSRKFSLFFIFLYGAIVGTIRVFLQVALQVYIHDFFRLSREIFMNMIIFPFFITVFASVLLTGSARGLGGNGNFTPIVNFMFYANSFHIIIPFVDFIFNKLLGIPYEFELGIWGEFDINNPLHCLFTNELIGLTAGIIFVYVLIIIRTPNIVRYNFKISLKRSVLACTSLLLMFWIIFISVPFWFIHFSSFFHLPAKEDGYTLIFVICILISFPYFWKNFKKEREIKFDLNIENNKGK